MNFRGTSFPKPAFFGERGVLEGFSSEGGKMMTMGRDCSSCWMVAVAKRLSQLLYLPLLCHLQLFYCFEKEDAIERRCPRGKHAVY
jgi:hypothetical protein